MARSLKSTGLVTLEDVRKRVLRQYTLGRISVEDCNRLLDMLEDIMRYIEEMKEVQSAQA